MKGDGRRSPKIACDAPSDFTVTHCTPLPEQSQDVGGAAGQSP